MPRHAAVLRPSLEGDPARSVRAILDLGYEGMGLEHPLHALQWDAIRDLLPRESVVSVQLFLPYPRSLRRAEVCPYSPASLHPEEKRDAVQQGLETIVFAERHAIPYVQIAPVILDGNLRESLLAIRRSRLSVAERTAQLESRRKDEAAPRLDSLRSLLSKLLDAADRYGVRIAMTPGGFIDELPSIEESASILHELRGAPLCVWTDTLRVAAAMEAGPPGRLLDVLGTAIAGLTVRDFSQVGEPVPPGEGCMDREALRPFCERASIWMVDPVLGDAENALEEGRKLLESLGRGPESEAKPGFRLL